MRSWEIILDRMEICICDEVSSEEKLKKIKGKVIFKLKSREFQA